MKSSVRMTGNDLAPLSAVNVRAAKMRMKKWLPLIPMLLSAMLEQTKQRKLRLFLHVAGRAIPRWSTLMLRTAFNGIRHRREASNASTQLAANLQTTFPSALACASRTAWL
jgi:hypothetical protein